MLLDLFSYKYFSMEYFNFSFVPLYLPLAFYLFLLRSKKYFSESFIHFIFSEIYAFSFFIFFIKIIPSKEKIKSLC